METPKKIIFLEPLKVLNSPKFRKTLMKENNNHYFEEFDYIYEPAALELLKQVVDKTGANIVLYSQSRCCSSKVAQVMHGLSSVGLNNAWIDTVSRDLELSKSKALKLWLSQHSNMNFKYCVLDNMLNYDTPEQTLNIVWADERNGLTEPVAQKMIEILN